MKLQIIKPFPELRPFISKLWVFESNGPVPTEDMKLVVPNGLIKLVIPFKNGLSGRFHNWSHLSKENSITLIGVSDMPAIVETENDNPSGTIGIEFSPLGAYRFFDMKLDEIKNKIYALTDVYGSIAKQLEDRISDAEAVNEKINILQHFLVRQLNLKERDIIFDHCIQKIIQNTGRVPVLVLEKETGYSSRWLNTKFTEKIGISPKNLSSIIRFQQFYKSWANSNEKAFFKKSFYDYYYDQSHFIKDFKRFTGYSPTKFAMSENEFGRIFYKE